MAGPTGGTEIIRMSESTRQIPFLDLQPQHQVLREEIFSAVHSVFERQDFVLGQEVAQLEMEMSPWFGGADAITCASGTDALRLALSALGIGIGDEVITTPFSFFATASTIALAGAKPVFVDIQADSFNLDPSRLQAAITTRTRAIIPVHLFGQPADMSAIGRFAQYHHIAVIEDACQSFGARYGMAPVGTLGALGCFSFYPAKVLGGAGEGGMVTTLDPGLADRCRLLRAHGANHDYRHSLLGWNARMDTLQAAVLRIKLRYAKQWILQRCERADRYSDLFRSRGLATQLRLPQVPAFTQPVWHQYVIRTPSRDSLRSFLSACGIETRVFYPIPLHLQPALASLGYRQGDLPVAEQCAEEVVALPIYPELSYEDQVYVADKVAQFFEITS